MTLDQATQAAKDEANRMHQAYVVWRLPKWPPGCYGVLPKERGLPPDSEVAFTAQPSAMDDLIF